ncbi:MAG TPA: hypothetical protein VMT27_09850 [Actinomycetes bacterium]|nr:hypothetical protein [Actinomycetes bacterium]
MLCARCKNHVPKPDESPGDGWEWELWVCVGDGSHSWARRRVPS